MDNRALRELGAKVAAKLADYAAAAIVGALAVAGGIWAVTHLGGNVLVPAWLVAIIAGFALIGALSARINATRRTKIQHRMVQLVELDESLLSLFPSLVRDKGREEAVKRLLYEFLRDATRLLGKSVSRGSILHEDKRHKLVMWVAYQMPPESQKRTQFDVHVQSDKGRGIAGETYSDQFLRVVHMVEREGRWVPEVFKEAGGKWVRDEEARYKAFDVGRPHPPYRSFVTVPVISASQECLGVLCFDSTNEKEFDFSAIRQLLVNLSTRIAAVAILYRHLPTSNPLPGNS